MAPANHQPIFPIFTMGFLRLLPWQNHPRSSSAVSACRRKSRSVSVSAKRASEPSASAAWAPRGSAQVPDLEKSHPKGFKCDGNMLEILWKCYGNVMEMVWKYYGNVMEMLWKYEKKDMGIHIRMNQQELEIETNWPPSTSLFYSPKMIAGAARFLLINQQKRAVLLCSKNPEVRNSKDVLPIKSWSASTPQCWSPLHE